VALVPSSGGAFEVTLGDQVVYSKLQTGVFPSEGNVIQAIGEKI